jgi:hypothetical protein
MCLSAELYIIRIIETISKRCLEVVSRKSYPPMLEKQTKIGSGVVPEKRRYEC